MGLFNSKLKRERILDFSDENVELLAKLTDELGDTLIKSGFGLYVDYLSEIRLSAVKKDSVAFEKLVVSNQLLGGAGALWELWIEGDELRQKFDQQLGRMLDHFKKMGIRNGRLDQVRNGFRRVR